VNVRRVRKIVCAVHGPVGDDLPPIEGLRACSVQRPFPGEPPEHPPDVGGVVLAWIDDAAPDAPALDPASWFGGAPVDAYLVDEHVRIDYERDWPDGTPSPGPRRLSFVRKAPGISRDKMARHWGKVHFPLARVHHPALWRYVQNVVIEPLTSDAPDVDGIAELHFRSVSDLRDRFYDSDEGRARIREDVTHFLDRSAGWRIVAEETWLRS
jgi:uncharacterized protein (TIGR02118 family)